MGDFFAHSLASPSTQASSAPDYVIYTFRKDDGSRSSDLWQALGASKDLQQARAKAQALYSSSRYSRIELRKKYVSQKTGAVMNVPVEIFGARQNAEMRRIILLLCLAFGCAVAAIAISALLA